MWSDVFLSERERKGKVEKFAIILIDTQGLFDSSTTTADNSKIFALGALISSTQIFNLHDVLEEHQLEFLHLAAEYAMLVAQNSTTQRTKPFQNLLFLMRDWQHKTLYKFGLSSGNMYLDNQLGVTDDQSVQLQDVRKFIRASFDALDCFLMPHPGVAVTKSLTYNGQHSLLSNDFKHYLKEAIEWLFASENLKNKRISKQEVSGRDFNAYLKIYLEIFRAPETPQVKSLYEVTSERQLNLIVDEAIVKYRDQLGADSLFLETQSAETMNEIHQKAKKDCVAWFSAQQKMGSKSQEQWFKDKLSKSIDAFYKQWTEQAEKARIKISEIQQQHEQALEELRKNLNATLAEQNQAHRAVLAEAHKNVSNRIKALEKRTQSQQSELDQQVLQLRNQNEELNIQLLISQKNVRDSEREHLAQLARDVQLIIAAGVQKVINEQKRTNEQLLGSSFSHALANLTGVVPSTEASVQPSTLAPSHPPQKHYENIEILKRRWIENPKIRLKEFEALRTQEERMTSKSRLTEDQAQTGRRRVGFMVRPRAI